MRDEAKTRTVQGIADAGADSIARWRASKRALRMNHYRRRLQKRKDTELQRHTVAWLLAVERDERSEKSVAAEISEQVPV